MSATAIPTGDAEMVEEAPREEAVAQTATARKIFKYSEFVDIGEGAVECEHARDGQCDDPGHFHAWCRLPNRYQEEDIRSKGQAAKARRIRALRDPESDLAVVLESELETVNEEHFRDVLIDELIGEELPNDYVEAQTDVDEREEYEHIRQDQEEYQRLSAAEFELPEGEQSEEFKRLRAHIGEYLDAVRARLAEIQEPRREELGQRTHAQLVETVRAKRIDEEGSRAFMDTYNAWTIFVGTFHPDLHDVLKKPHRPRWEDIGQRDRPAAGTMYGEDRDVLEELTKVFLNLRTAFRQGSAGN